MLLSEDRIKGLMVYSSRTGNTKKLMEGVAKLLAIPSELYSIGDISADFQNPWILVGFWVDRGTADKNTLTFLEGLSGRKIGLLGTLGAYPDSSHAKEVEAGLKALVSKNNDYLGCFLCQGRVDPVLIEQFKGLPPDHPHGMNEERRKRLEEASKHPNEEDFISGASFCAAMLKAAGFV